MRPLERVPAVRRIETDRDDAFAVEITGEFTSADAENLCGLLEGAYVLHERLDLLVRIAAIDGVDVSDLAPETADTLRRHAATHVGRCAVVGEQGWVDQIAGLFEPGPSTQTRHFSPQDEPLAWEWIDAREIEERV